METLEKIKMTLLIVIPACAGARIMYCLIHAAADEEESGKMARRIKNIISFLVISVCLTSVVAVIVSYYPMSSF